MCREREPLHLRKLCERCAGNGVAGGAAHYWEGQQNLLGLLREGSVLWLGLDSGLELGVAGMCVVDVFHLGPRGGGSGGGCA